MHAPSGSEQAETGVGVNATQTLTFAPTFPDGHSHSHSASNLPLHWPWHHGAGSAEMELRWLLHYLHLHPRPSHHHGVHCRRHGSYLHRLLRRHLQCMQYQVGAWAGLRRLQDGNFCHWSSKSNGGQPALRVTVCQIMVLLTLLLKLHYSRACATVRHFWIKVFSP